MVYDGSGLSYTEVAGMDLATFFEAIEAKILYIDAIKQRQQMDATGR